MNMIRLPIALCLSAAMAAPTAQSGIQTERFAAAFWVSADTGAIVWKNLRPASWLRMFMFQSTISTEQLGLVLNVVDRDRDGWAEVIFLQAGYEGIGVELFEVSANDVKPSGIRYGYGC